MFAKNRPTKRVELGDGNWVEIGHLSKGQKDEIQSEISALFKNVEIDPATNKPKEGTTVPDDLLSRTQAAVYKRLSYAIKSWSAEGVPVSIETIKDLDEEAFDKIVEEVNTMNELSKAEVKN